MYSEERTLQRKELTSLAFCASSVSPPRMHSPRRVSTNICTPSARSWGTNLRTTHSTHVRSLVWCMHLLGSWHMMAQCSKLHEEVMDAK